jgi:hypothetical protein
LLASAASAQTNLYTIRGNATAGSNDIWSVNPTTGAETLIYNGYPGGNAATLAQRPSDGMIFYAINGTNGAVYRFNPATPNIAPVAIGNLGPTPLGVNVSGGFRMAFSPAGTLYYMVGTGGAADPNTLYTVNKSTGQATRLTTITGAGDGGDIAFSGATIYIVDQNRILYTSSTAGGAATTVGTITFGGATPNTIGIAFDGAGRLLRRQCLAPAGSLVCDGNDGVAHQRSAAGQLQLATWRARPPRAQPLDYQNGRCRNRLSRRSSRLHHRRHQQQRLPCHRDRDRHGACKRYRRHLTCVASAGRRAQPLPDLATRLTPAPL